MKTFVHLMVLYSNMNTYMNENAYDLHPNNDDLMLHLQWHVFPTKINKQKQSIILAERKEQQQKKKKKIPLI